MLMWLRRLGKPECISADIALARARSAGAEGQSFGFFSAMYSRMASESHTVVLPSTSTGTLPAGEYWRIACFEAAPYNGILFSSKSKPNTLSASQGRSDQDE